jgi:phosphoglycerol transferase MdoB-like AlkP superfamily enzyme
MIILLKIILSFFIVLGVIVIRTLYKDFRTTEKTEEYENITIADKIKIKFILYVSLIAICSFCLLLLYYVIAPMQITW